MTVGPATIKLVVKAAAVLTDEEMLFSGVVKSSGIVPPKSLIARKLVVDNVLVLLTSTKPIVLQMTRYIAVKHGIEREMILWKKVW